MNALPEEIAGIAFSAVLAVEGLPDARSISYFSGSIVAGYGNAWSDLDVYVVGDREPTGPYLSAAREATISIHYEFDRRIDFEFWPLLAVSKLAERLAAVKIGDALPDEYFSQSEEAFIHNLRIGITTREQAPSLEQLRHRFDFDIFKRYLVQKSFRVVDHLVEDVCGMLESGDSLVSILAARKMVGFAVDGYCHFLGNTSPSNKWRLHHLRIAAPHISIARLQQRYLDLEFPSALLKTGDAAAARDYTNACLELVNEIAAVVQH